MAPDAAPSWAFEDFTHRGGRQGLAAALASRVARRLEVAIAQRSEASLVLSGGSTPVEFLGALQQQTLEWRQLNVTLTDERWVPPHDEHSNERLVRAHLLHGPASKARFVSLTTADATPEAGAAAVARRFAQLPRPLDVVVAGMGGDLHTASLFPGMANLDRALDPHDASAVLPATAPSHPRQRMTLTLAALSDCRRLFLLLHGEEKRLALEQALERTQRTNEDAPVIALLRAVGARATVYWAP